MARLLDWAEVWARELDRWVGGIWKSSAAGKASLVAVAAICSLGEVRGLDLPSKHRQQRRCMRRKLAVFLTALFVSSLGATACGGVQQQVEDRAREEVQKGRKQVEKKVQEGRKQVEKKVQEGRKQVEKQTR